jgi:hypothetical protein
MDARIRGGVFMKQIIRKNKNGVKLRKPREGTKNAASTTN